MKKFIYLVVALAFTLTACQKIDNGSTEQRGKISVAATIDANTRAPQLEADGSGSFAQGDVLGIFVVRDNEVNKGQLVDYYFNNAFTIGGTNSFYWENVEASKILFAGYWPKAANEVIADPTKYVFTPSAAASAAEQDLLAGAGNQLVYAGQEAEYKATINFGHMMHKIVVKLQSSDNTYSAAELGGATVKVMGLKPTSEVDVIAAKVNTDANGDYVVSGEAKELSSGVSELVCSFVVAPQNVEALVGGAFVKVEFVNAATNAPVSYTFKLPAQIMNGTESVALEQLESGKCLTLTVNICKVAVDVDVDGKIGPWTTQGSTSGNPDINFGNN